MKTTLEAVYEKGVLKLASPLPLPEQARVLVTIQAPDGTADDPERTAWLQLAETALIRTWDNADDEVFNELLQK